MKYISNLIFFLILLFLPTQLGKHFWPDFSMVSGIRVDYLSPTLYLTDILVLLLFVIWISEKFLIFNSQFKIKSKFLKFKHLNIINSFQISRFAARRANFKFQISLFVAFLAIGIIFSKSPALGFYGLLKILEFGFFGFYTANYLRGASFYFVIGIIFESLLGIAHYLNQGSIGGILYFFGEREFNQNTPGIANASINGELILRPYGTFPHPNVLAGYLIIAMAIMSEKFNPSTKLRTGVKSSKSEKAIYGFSILLGTVALFLTMSRIAILLWIAFLFVKIYSMFKYKSISLLVLITFLAIILFSPLSQRFININPMDESVQLRKELIQTSLVMIEHNPLFGVGLNNFLVNTTSYLQPVHNIYLLIASEIGLVGFAFFVWFIMTTYIRVKRQKTKDKRQKLIILSMVLVLGMFDHYFLTLQQGQLLFSFILGLCWQGKK
ncbi:MAG: O-antigen ligase family protein [bacterium]|nr:O-antigen ligase family protein [bacterium]